MKNSFSPFLKRMALRYYEGLGGSKALTAAILLRYEQWDELAALSADPRCYIDAQTYMRANAACCLLKKLKCFPGGEERRATALRKWYDGEHQCFRSNERLSVYLPEHVNHVGRIAGVEAFLSSARKQIENWIGRTPPDLLVGRHGPGATFSDRGQKSSVPDKMNSNPSLTPDAVWFLPQWFGTQWGAAFAQRQGGLSFIRGNRFTTVPKNAKTDRSIAAEPSINVFYQLGLGKALRARLKANASWDLKTAQEVHRRVACESSVSRRFATLDLSNASDTVCNNLVKLLLPPRWYDQLNDLRSKFTLVDGKWVQLEKFSSMGCGFTFELETIIFASLCAAALQSCSSFQGLGKDLFVFGDDIIVPNQHVRFVKSVLEFFGFKLNDEKSFYGDEPFRESCGGDYFMGQPVRGSYCDDDPSEPSDYIVIANSIRAMASRLTDDSLNVSWFYVLDQLPTSVRQCRGPSELGDIVIHDDRSNWSLKTRNSIRYIKSFRPAKVRVIPYSLFDPDVVLACATYGCGQYRGGVIPRDGVRGYKVGWVPYS